MMKRLTCALLVLVCLKSTYAQDVETKKKLGIAGAALGRAIEANDIPALEKLWSPKMIVNGPNNAVLTRAEIFDAMKHGQLNYEGGYKSTLEKVEFFGDIAVTMGEDTYTPNFGPEKGKVLHRRSTNVWQYADGAWMMIARKGQMDRAPLRTTLVLRRRM